MVQKISIDTIVMREGFEVNCPKGEGGGYFIGTIEIKEGIPYAVSENKEVIINSGMRIGIRYPKISDVEFRYYFVRE